MCRLSVTAVSHRKQVYMLVDLSMEKQYHIWCIPASRIDGLDWSADVPGPAMYLVILESSHLFDAPASTMTIG